VSPFAVDSNVIVYAFDRDAGSKHQRAREILLSAPPARLRLPLQAAGETFAVLTRRRGWATSEARDVVENLMTLMPIIAATSSSVSSAMLLSERHSVSFWDAQIVAAAAAGGCSGLLSEEVQDGRRFAASDVGRVFHIVNPFNEANRAMLETSGLLRTN